MMQFSIVIPVYNRPDEVDELLQSLSLQTFKDFEVVLVDDGSDLPCESIVKKYSNRINIRYFFKKNSGPGLTRNFAAERANGDYLIFLDSDCIVPRRYFEIVSNELKNSHVDFFGGPDASHESFTDIQKAIGYSMTSFYTTGGIRGGRLKLERFTPRSFNMGVSRRAFNSVEGFASMRFGEDVDLSLRLFEKGFKSRLFPNAFVYHKRRTDFRKFFKQVFNSGMARINLAINHKGSLKLVHLLPTGFVIAMFACLLLSFFYPLFLALPVLYSVLLFIDSMLKGNGFKVSLLGIAAAWVQLFGYGLGFIYALWLWAVHGTRPQGAFIRNFYR